MKKIIHTLIIIIFSYTVSAQDMHFSQFNNTPMLTNPALTGAFAGNHRIIANFRSQWKSVTKAYTTYGLSYDVGFLKKKLKSSFLAVGIQVFNDQSGDVNLGVTEVKLTAAYHLGINPNNMLAVGLQTGWGQRRTTISNMIYGSQYDPFSPGGYNPALPTNETSPFVNIDYGDFSAGILWHYNSKKSTVNTPETKKVTAGLAVFHINRPRQTYYYYPIANDNTFRERMKFVFHLNSSIGFSGSKISLQPSAAAFIQGEAYDILLGSLFSYRIGNSSYYTKFNPETFIGIGGYYRVGDAVVLMAQLDWKNFLLGLSYDINISKLSNVSNGGGGFEVSLRYSPTVATAGNKNLY